MAPVSAPRPRITVVDYGMGNLRSASKAPEHVGADVVVSGDGEVVAAADAIVLPGVGAFPEAMRQIEARGLATPIRERVSAGAPLLGICLGMQLLFESSEEHGGAEGLGLLEGRVDALRAKGLKLPHIGWSPVLPGRESALTSTLDPAGEPFYFVHSFVARPAERNLIATSEHGEEFAAIVGDGRVFGTQFHPEKSSTAGLEMLASFVSIATPAEVA